MRRIGRLPKAIAVIVGAGVLAGGIYQGTTGGSSSSGGSQTPWTTAVFINYTCPGDTFYVDRDATGSNNGTSWTDAWQTLGAINWGSVGSDDCVYFSDGSYTGTMTVTSSGTSGHPIKLLAASQGGHTGVVTFTGGITVSNKSYVTVDGQGADATDQFWLINGNWTSQTTSNVIARYVEINDASIVTGSGSSGDVWDHVWIHNVGDGDTADSAFNCNVNTGATNNYDQVVFTNSHLEVVSKTSEDGTGPDGFSTCRGLTVTKSLIEGQPLNTYTGTQHQDLLQILTNYITVTNNVFKDGADSILDWDCNNAQTQPNHIRIFNNQFIKARGGAMIRFYFGCNTFDEVHVDNNDFIDHTAAVSTYGGFSINNLSGNPTVSNSEIENNVFYNDTISSPINIDASSGWVAADWNIDFNNISGGSGGFVVDGAGYTQTNPSTCAPGFTTYNQDTTAYSQTYSQWVGANYTPSPSDTCLANNGTSLSSLFTVDYIDTTRPQGSAWDIGAYERVGG